MSRTFEDDLSGLALHARRRTGDLRPLVLRAQTEAFCASPFPDRAFVESYEALALGLIPLVSADVLRDVKRLLDSVGWTPPAVRDAVTLRSATIRQPQPHISGARPAPAPGLERRQIVELVSRDRREIDLALAADTRIVIDGHALRELVGRARSRRRLARTLLLRRDLTVFDRAALYRHAPDDVRPDIRRGLKHSPLGLAGRIHDPLVRAAILEAADHGDLTTVARDLADSLSLSAEPHWRLGSAAQRELFALALIAAGLTPCECLRACLAQPVVYGQRSAALLSLATLVRTTPAAVATFLVAEDAAAPTRRGISISVLQDEGGRFERPRRTGPNPLPDHDRSGERSRISARL